MLLKPVSQLDFDAEYGRKYRTTIQHSVPGHATLLEIAAAAIGEANPAARRLLVVGPGPGDELPQLLEACPEADFVVVEPSAQMLQTSIETVKGQSGFQRCQWVPKTLEEAVHSGLLQRDFDGVICHNVLHLMAADQQDLMIESLVEQSLPGGVLLVSSYSEAAEPWVCETIFSIAARRLLDRGLPAEMVDKFLTARNTAVFSLDAARFESILLGLNCQSPIQLYQGLFARLWITRRNDP
ncbi:trans-aconitate 2-methyltransferase [Synechococcus sp. MIT S9508]|uniref:class I SAM-dependent methyltransferase n=1 Tax=Synechococcus sp. MIT S9508 TaxID=1801629 RepID=UPI0007BB9B21|nr:class I SAM-dependent methyltransferase [Synechococcus sp. MIT S9508]KZR88416.1 tRNA (cmo5U34)-methyltransferase [Synechococcus sp. MIT S9508]